MDSKKATRIHLHGQLDPFIASELTNAIYSARLLHLQKGNYVSEEEITSEVIELWVYLISRLKATQPDGYLEILTENDEPQKQPDSGAPGGQG